MTLESARLPSGPRGTLRFARLIGWIRDRTLAMRMAGIETVRKHQGWKRFRNLGVHTPKVMNTSTAIAANTRVTYVIE